MNKRLLSIILVVFIDLLGFSLILPLLPYYAEKYGATQFMTGLLVASYAAMQLIGAPLLGRLSDRFGRRPVLLASVFGTFIGFLLLGFADSIGTALANAFNPQAANIFVLAILFVSRMVDGLTGGNLSVAQAYISDVTDAQNRSKGLGMIGAAFGLGFIIGPATGGLLSQWGYAVPGFVAAALSLSNLMLIYFWLPESLTEEKRAEMPDKKPAITFAALIRALTRPFTGALLTTRFFFGLAFAIFQTVFSLYALQKFNLQARDTGFILTYVGVLAVIVQGFLIGRLTKRYREDTLIFFSGILMTIALIGWALTPSVFWLLVVLTPTALSGGLLNTLLSSTLTKSVQPQEIGGILGLSSAIESSTRIIAPILGGYVLQAYGTWSPGAIGALLMLGISIFIFFNIFNHPVAAEIRARSMQQPAPAPNGD
ncbi:MAG TPA: MFS transporter [Anaerolineales bacterium]|nr:MFS transporter [Anaerolineales bacterium]HNO31105.1 MFS transporter [Anaerolineales bacterium]